MSSVLIVPALGFHSGQHERTARRMCPLLSPIAGNEIADLIKSPSAVLDISRVPQFQVNRIVRTINEVLWPFDAAPILINGQSYLVG